MLADSGDSSGVKPGTEAEEGGERSAGPGEGVGADVGDGERAVQHQLDPRRHGQGAWSGGLWKRR